MAAHKGHVKVGGRVKGTPNKDTQTIQEMLASLGCDPLKGMATIALNQLPCGVCRGSGKTKYRLDLGDHAKGCDGTIVKPATLCKCEGIGERTCLSCYGSLFENCSPDLRGRMNAELAQYVAPKRKAIDLTNSDGSMRPSWEVIMVKGQNLIAGGHLERKLDLLLDEAEDDAKPS